MSQKDLEAEFDNLATEFKELKVLTEKLFNKHRCNKLGHKFNYINFKDMDVYSTTFSA